MNILSKLFFDLVLRKALWLTYNQVFDSKFENMSGTVPKGNAWTIPCFPPVKTL